MKFGKNCFIRTQINFRTLFTIYSLIWLSFLYFNPVRVLFSQSKSQNQTAKILVGPDILVTGEGNSPHAEVIIAANHRNGKNLLGAGIDVGNYLDRVYVSTDGGYSWIETSPGERHDYNSADPQVAFGIQGTAYFVEMCNRKDRSFEPSEHLGLRFYRSKDGGLNWQEPSHVNPGYSSDHPQIAVDLTKGQYAGRVYIGAASVGLAVRKDLLSRTGGRSVPSENWNVGVFRSDDDGRSFVGPVIAVKGKPGGKGVTTQVINLLVLSDGTLFVSAYELVGKPQRNIWCVLSKDGGVSFSGIMNVQKQVVDKKLRNVNLPVVFAVDTHTEQFQDRIYCVWSDQRSGKTRILLSYSADRGKTWSEPEQVDKSAPNGAHQYLPAVAVNDKGIVGVSWYDTRYSNVDGIDHEFFAVSDDGGESFLSAVQVSSQEYYPRTTSGITLMPRTRRTSTESISLRFLETGQRWPGHYQGIVADTDGTFYPFWVDKRTGNYQIWTSQIVVKLDEVEQTRKTEAKVKTDITDKLELIFETIKYDSLSEVAEVPVRLKNKTEVPIYPPIILEITSITGLAELAEQPRSAGYKEKALVILNAHNGKQGAGAVFDFSKQLGDFESLVPGAVTGALTWRVKIVDPFTNHLHDLNMSASGYIENK